MSSNPIDPNSAMERLRLEGYKVEVRDQHLLVHSIPFVTARKVVRYGTLVCLYLKQGEQVVPPNGPGDNHQVWWTEEYPCYPDGTVLDLGSDPSVRELLPGLTVRNRFSSKPNQYVNGYPDHYAKITYYVRMIQNQAKAIDSEVDACTGEVVETQENESVFRYPDTASARAEILAISAKLAVRRVAIVGLGGTGSYLLDQIAKTPVGEIHLFDGDILGSHNAFRAPGAASIAEVNAREPKTDYFARKYDPMRRGIMSHAYFLDQSNVHELAGFDFVFICVDKGTIRAMLVEFLIDKEISFVDTGMNLKLVAQTNSLIGTCRATLVTPTKSNHVTDYIPMDSDDDDVLYRQNIQVADMNAINAMLAVIKWKQYLGFYGDDFKPYNLSFGVNLMSLNRGPKRLDGVE
ncbi:ThiF family adenylyltransferase [Pseudomonas sp. P154a]|jgi:Dinucleotide-utilizing enzymes involved in molybdopterin and thiamine biosynthesis family 1|uniref:ThiF family adenylyltransferase n=1 Tax=Pseudomonas mucoides TaxID=2730424 RepID=UPI0018926CED|nr:ThiF family adenylyltransferase [Pseudomonas mucoides]MBF6042531.1 ThiF family adenylyltransferase [Pseudomonas mucoides]